MWKPYFTTSSPASSQTRAAGSSLIVDAKRTVHAPAGPSTRSSARQSCSNDGGDERTRGPRACRRPRSGRRPPRPGRCRPSASAPAGRPDRRSSRRAAGGGRHRRPDPRIARHALAFDAGAPSPTPRSARPQPPAASTAPARRPPPGQRLGLDVGRPSLLDDRGDVAFDRIRSVPGRDREDRGRRPGRRPDDAGTGSRSGSMTVRIGRRVAERRDAADR